MSVNFFQIQRFHIQTSEAWWRTRSISMQWSWKCSGLKLFTVNKVLKDCRINFIAAIGFGQHFNCPVIALSTFSTSKWTNDLTKTPMENSYVAHNFIKFSNNMNFYERTLNTLTSQYENIFMEMVHYERQVRWQLKFITFEPNCRFYLAEENFSFTFLRNFRQSDEECVVSFSESSLQYFIDKTVRGEHDWDWRNSRWSSEAFATWV